MEESKIILKKFKHNIIILLYNSILFKQNVLIKYTSNTSNVNYTLFYVLKVLMRFGLVKPLKS